MKQKNNITFGFTSFLLAMLVSWLTCSSAFGQPICKVIRYDNRDGLAQWHLSQLIQDYNGLLWIATWNGLYRFDGYEFKCFKSNVGDGCDMVSDRIRNIWPTEEGDIYCKVDEDIFLFNSDTYHFNKIAAEEAKNLEKEELTHNQSSSTIDLLEYTDKYSTKWRITQEGELSYFDNEKASFIPYPLDINPKKIRFYQPDAQGNLWALSPTDLYRLEFSYKPIEEFPLEEDTQIKCLFLDKKKRYWVVGRDKKSISLYDADNTLLGYLKSDGTLNQQAVSFGASIYCITQTRNGTIWLGSKPDGIFRLHEQKDGRFKITHFTSDNNVNTLNHNDVYDITEDRWGRLWIATLGGGINCMTDVESDNPRIIHNKNELKGYPTTLCQRVRYIHITDDDILLAATTEGLIISELSNNKSFEEQIFTRHAKEAARATSLSCNATMDILEDQNGNIFVSTESGGVNQIINKELTTDTLSFRHFNTQNGMPNDIVFSMTEVNNRLWIVSCDQIIILNTKTGRAESYDQRFFQRQCRFSDAHPLLLPDGRWMFGLQDGAFTLTTDNMKKSNFVPNIVLTGISIQNREINPAVNKLKELRLKSNERSVTIHFASLDYTNAKSINYAFRLDREQDHNDKQKPWNYINQGRSATFLDMVPGKYTLMIRSTNGDGVWVENARTLTIIVTPTFWETGWAKLLLFIVISGVIATIIFVYLYIKRINKQQKETLEAYLALIKQPIEEKIEKEGMYEEVQDEEGTQNSKEDTKTKYLSKEDDLFMKRIMNFVEEQICNPDASIGDMASAAATSRSGLNRKLKSILGITPLDLLREARIKRACQLLKKSNNTISEVAFACGFSDPKYFSRCFKSSVGVSPSDYKAKEE